MTRRQFLPLLCFCVAAPAQEMTPEQRRLNLESFDKVWTTVRDQHWDPTLGGVDWPAVRDELRPKFEKAETLAECRAILRQMLDRLGQTHFSIVAGDVYQEIDPGSGDGSTGLDARVLDGKGVVTSVEEGSSGRAAGVRPGWQILKIGGRDLAPALERIAEAYKTSTMRELVLTRAVTSRLAGKIGSQAKVEFLDGGGKTVELEMERRRPRGVRASFGYLPARHVWLESRKLDGNIGLIAFNIFLDPANVMRGFEDAVKSFVGCDGILIDLRGNPGGLGAMSMGMAGWFIEDADRRLGTMYTRQTPLRFVVNPRLPWYGGPLAVLVDGDSASTSEIFAGGLKDLGRARIFGTRTAGAALPSVFERLPNGDGFQYAIANYISEGGKPLEGAGVIPDVEVRLSREALLEGRDPVIEAAVSWVRAQKKL